MGWVYQYAVMAARRTLAELRTTQDWQVRFAVAKAEGVAEVVAAVGVPVREGGQVSVPLPPGSDAGAVLGEMAARLASAGIEVAELGVRLASLDEVFLALTGVAA